MRCEAQVPAGVERDALRREQFVAGKRREIWVARFEIFGDLLVLLTQDAASGVYQPAARLEQARGGGEDAALLRGELRDRRRRVAPLQVRVAPQRAEAAARRVDQHAVELAGEPLRARIVIAR